MTRISPAAVLAACRARPDIAVVTRSFGDFCNCGCPLTLFALSLGDLDNEQTVTSFLMEHGYSKEYIEGFWHGVDERPYPVQSEAYLDGAATRELLVREGVLS